MVNVFQKGSAIINTTQLIKFELSANLFTPISSGTGGNMN